MADDRRVTELRAWFDAHMAAAPSALRARMHEHLRATPAGGDSHAQLAAAARGALERVLHRDGGRDVALDLLAADGLITLALLRTAVAGPSELGTVARRLTEGAPPAP